MEMLTAALAVLCALLTLVLLIQRPSIWPVLLALVVAWGICMAAFRYQLRRWLSRWVRGDNFEKSKTIFSLEQLSQPTALLSGETVLWYNEQFRARLLGGQDMLTSRVQKVLPGLDLQQCRTQQGQLLTLADGTSIVTEGIWENRFRYVDELLRMGANIQVDGQVAVIEGVRKLRPAPLRATDLRAGAAMVMAALSADGISEVDETIHIERGYENIVEKLQLLGADIRRVEAPRNAINRAI